MSFGIESLSLVQAIGIWSDLLEAYYGVNGYGGNVAEIYAYRLQEYNPTAHSEVFTNLREEAASELAVASARRLQGLIGLFCERYDDARISIDGTTWRHWHSPLAHRCHVKVTRKARKR